MPALKHSIHWLPQTDSTNSELWRLAETDPSLSEGSVVWAGHQTRGRGQGNTSWEGEAGENLCFSILLRPHFLSPSRQFLLNKAITTGLRHALARMANMGTVAIKWPNDIYADGGKLAGTLIENRLMGNTWEFCVAGLGVNINQQGFPAHLPHAVSLSMLTGRQYGLKDCLDSILSEISRTYARLAKGKEGDTDRDYRLHLMGLGRPMAYSAQGRVFKASICGVSDHGKLLLREEDGCIREYGMKEIEMLA